MFSSIVILGLILTMHCLGSCGVIAAEKKPTMHPRDVDNYLNKTGNVSHVLMKSDCVPKIGGQLDANDQRYVLLLLIGV